MPNKNVPGYGNPEASGMTRALRTALGFLSYRAWFLYLKFVKCDVLVYVGSFVFLLVKKSIQFNRFLYLRMQNDEMETPVGLLWRVPKRGCFSRVFENRQKALHMLCCPGFLVSSNQARAASGIVPKSGERPPIWAIPLIDLRGLLISLPDESENARPH